MAGSRLLPLLLVALTLLPKAPGKSSLLAFTGIAFSLFWENRASDLRGSHQNPLTSETSSAPVLSVSATESSAEPTSSEPSPTTHLIPSSSGASSAHTDHSSPGTDTSTLPSPASAEPGPPTPLSPGSTDLRTASATPASGSPGSEPSSPSAPGGWTPARPSRGDTEAPTSQRNPGVVVAICLVLSVLLIGSVLMGVRSCRRDVSEFHKLDEVSLRSMNRRKSSSHRPPE